MSSVATAVVGGSIVAGYLGGEAAKDAAGTSADASRYAADLNYEQYLQSRQDLSPYREAAVGQEIYGTTPEYQRAVTAWEADGSKGEAPKESDFQGVTGYTGGALNTLAEYGRSQVSPGDYIPDSQIPTYQGLQIGQMPSIDQRVSDFSGQSNIPEFDSTQFDIYKDPSYEWRKEEMLRGVDRTAGATGKITSGNRMEEIMARSGEMASQEYGAARDRMVQDYGLRRGAESEQYGRDVGEYGLTRSAEDARYGRGVDEYGRTYGRDVDQYGRDLTSYNALVSQEAGQYGRGVDAYGRAYGQEGDYLNRQANLANIGQAATNTGVQAGTSAAYSSGQAIQAAGQAQAAGQIGQASAYQNVLGDLSSMYGSYQSPTPYAGDWVSSDPSVWG